MMLRNITMKNPATILTVLAMILGLALTACGGEDSKTDEVRSCSWTPGGCGPTGPEAVVIIDASGSVQGTDLLDAAHNHVVDLINTMPIGASIYVRSFHSDITAMCRELVITRVKQPNTALDDQHRQATIAGFSNAYDRFLKCAEDTNPGGTRVIDGLAEAVTLHPTALTYTAYTDFCDTELGTCRPRNLRDKKYPSTLVQNLPVALTPALTPGTVIDFYGIGRNTGLSAANVNTLRTIAQTWSQATGATGQIHDV